MSPIAFSTNIEPDDKTLKFNLSMYIFREDSSFIVYCPAFDLSAYGDTEEQAQKAFREIFEITIRYEIENNTLVKDLKRLGWKIKRKPEMEIEAPSLDSLLRNYNFRDILSNKEYTSYRQEFGIPVLC
jgi:predicted RNase H-like HicB family nuclease